MIPVGLNSSQSPGKSSFLWFVAEEKVGEEPSVNRMQHVMPGVKRRQPCGAASRYKHPWLTASKDLRPSTHDYKGLDSANNLNQLKVDSLSERLDKSPVQPTF